MSKALPPQERDVDGFFRREARITAPPGAPFGDIVMVVRRPTNAMVMLLEQAAKRLLDHMQDEKRHVYSLDYTTKRQVTDRAVELNVRNFLTCVAQIEHASGVPGFEDWDEIELGWGAPRLLAAYDRWMELDNSLTIAIIRIVNRVDTPVEWTLDPNSEAASENG